LQRHIASRQEIPSERSLTADGKSLSSSACTVSGVCASGQTRGDQSGLQTIRHTLDGPLYLEKAYDMDGAFNDVVLTLTRAPTLKTSWSVWTASWQNMGTRFYGRKDQMSNRFLNEEFRQLQRSADIFPAIFISVAAFLLNVVISRTVSTQREQVAALKALATVICRSHTLCEAGGHDRTDRSCRSTAVGAWLGKGLAASIWNFIVSHTLNMSSIRVAVTAAL